MINCTPADAKELLALAERMGIPADDAIRRVVRQLTEPRRATERVAVTPVLTLDEEPSV